MTTRNKQISTLYPVQTVENEDCSHAAPAQMKAQCMQKFIVKYPAWTYRKKTVR